MKHFHSGERADFINSLPCVVGTGYGCGLRYNHHVKSRGAGGTYLDIVQLCDMHHGQLHTIGRETFERVYNVDLASCAEQTEKSWQQFVAGTGEQE